MSIYDKYNSRLEDLIGTSLAINPNTKKRVICLDNLQSQTGYMQYYVAKNMDGIHFDHHQSSLLEKNKSNLHLTENTNIVEYYNSMDNDKKNKQLIKLHNDGQELIGEIVHDAYKLVKENPNLYQAQLAELSGFSKKILDDNNRTFVTIFDIMREQNMLKKVKVGSKSYYKCIGYKPYKPSAYKLSRGYSKLEAKFCDLIKSLGINFQQQVIFADCKYKKCLPFDFLLIFDNGDELLVEIDGRQHYEHIPYFHPTIKDFELQQKRDKIKNKFAREYDINFLRIRYDENFSDKLLAAINEMELGI